MTTEQMTEQVLNNELFRKIAKVENDHGWIFIPTRVEENICWRTKNDPESKSCASLTGMDL
jgi:hypothetical protein